MRARDIVEGHNRIGTALWKSSIPPKYKQYRVIGQGATSVVLDRGDGNVLVLTRDAMKKDWLVQNWGLGLGEWTDTFDARHQQSREIGDMPVFVVQMPRLFPLSTENKRRVKKAIEQYYSITDKIKTKFQQDKFNAYLDAHPEGLFAQLVEFLQNYNDSQYGLDFLIRNFMQDAKGQIYLTDPIVSKEIVDALHNVAQKRYG